MKITVQFNGPVKKLNKWKPKAEIELEEGATAKDVCDHFNIDPEKEKLFGFFIRDGKKISLDEVIHDGDLLKANGKSAGG